MSENVKMAVIGCGHWGPNHIRSFSAVKGCSVQWACDIKKSQIEYVHELFPTVRTTTDYNDILDDPDVRAVVVSTPTSSHYELAKACLERGKDVLCEKPLAKTFDEARNLVRIAKHQSRTLMVGHIFLFNSGIRKLKEQLASREMGRLYYLQATRTNLGPIRQDVNAVLDLASHDVSIFNYLLDSEPVEVSAVGKSFVAPSIEDVAFITLIYPENILANIHVSWLAPRKVRQITIVGSRKMITWDDLVSIEPPIRIYNQGVAISAAEPVYRDFGEFQLILREEEITLPQVKFSEPLQEQSRHFCECLRNGRNPESDGLFGANVVRVLDAINLSVKSNGKPVAIAHPE